MIGLSVTIDSRAADAMLDRVTEAAINPAKAMRAIGREVSNLIRSGFRAEIDPWGGPWADHSETTKTMRKRAGDAGVQKLMVSGALFDSIDYAADANSATVKAGDGLAYARVHQEGNPNNRMFGKALAPIPARPFFPIRNGAADIPENWWSAVVKPIDQLLAEAIR